MNNDEDRRMRKMSAVKSLDDSDNEASDDEGEDSTDNHGWQNKISALSQHGSNLRN